MRAIEYKAWDRETKQMLSWEDINKLDTDGIVCFLDMAEEGQYILLQFTGRRDGGGKKIYEGDILLAYDCDRDCMHFLRVVYDSESLGFIFVDGAGNKYEPRLFDLNKAHVVGNIIEYEDYDHGEVH